MPRSAAAPVPPAPYAGPTREHRAGQAIKLIPGIPPAGRGLGFSIWESMVDVISAQPYQWFQAEPRIAMTKGSLEQVAAKLRRVPNVEALTRTKKGKTALWVRWTGSKNRGADGDE